MSSNPTDHPESKFWRRARRLLVGLALLATLLAIFYAEENWRGRRAWEKCKAELEAEGEAIDWSAYVPAEVPDEQNVFMAPKMTEWFVREGWSSKGGWEPGELSKRLGATSPSEFIHRSNAVAEITVLVPRDKAPAPSADLLLEYSGRVLSLADSNSISRKSETIPIIQFEDVPLSVAITNLAWQAGLQYEIDPQVTARWRDKAGRSVEPHVSFTLQDRSARAALMVLLEAYDLAWVEDSKTGIARVVALNPSGPLAILQPAAEERLKSLLQESLDRGTPGHQPVELSDVRRRKFVSGPLPEIKTLRLAVFADRVPRAAEVEAFLPRSVKPDGRNGWRAVATGSNTFNVFFREETVYSAADYLAWSDQFAPEFATIREALRRPQVLIKGDYQHPFARPIPDFVGVRNLAQLLAERAQCHLLLGRPEEALQDLTMMHDLRRLLSGKPTLLVAAMIDVAVTGLYTAIIADGLNLRAWREPQLVALQKQLAEINLPPVVLESLRTERAASCQTLLSLKPDEIVELFDFEKKRTKFWARIIYPPYLLMKVAPRGWVYQNLATASRVERAAILGNSTPDSLFFPSKAAEASREFDAALKHWSPFSILARIAIPNFFRALQTTAHNQTLANQAFIACGLERFRAAHLEFPESLDALVPEFLPRLPRDLIGGRPLHYRRQGDGAFLLYSVGWNETDDGGQAETTTGPSVHFSKDDWVWRTPLL